MIKPHLGGHLNKTHLDEGALLFLKNQLNINSMLDVGCGPGGMVKLALKHKIEAIGVDGDESLLKFNPEIMIHDYTLSKISFNKNFDLIWCVEFLEHIEEKYLDNIFDTFKQSKYIFCTHALPHEIGGHHHVNCQSEQYWIDKFGKNNFKYDVYNTIKLKNHSTMIKDFVRNTGKLFINNGV